jgi:acetylornithine/succinyldiaminopimelate/putrescine aminotransferase
VELATRLATLLPAPLDTVYFTSTGTEAIEGAMKTARKHTGRAGFVCFDGAFHGDTFGALSLGGNAVYRDPFEPLLPGVRRIPFDDVAALAGIDRDVAAVVIEPVQAEAGVRIPSPGYLAALRARCDEVGALLVFDEVVTAFGRTGRLFGLEHTGVVPDIIVLAKSLGGGLPLGAFVGRAEIMRTLQHDPPLAHVTTFGGHPLSCAAGLAALDVLERGHLVERSARMGAWLESQLSERIGRGGLSAVRGAGMLIGLEFDAPARCTAFAGRAFERGLILNWTLHRDTVVRLAPPLVLTEAEAADAVGRITDALG